MMDLGSIPRSVQPPAYGPAAPVRPSRPVRPSPSNHKERPMLQIALAIWGLIVIFTGKLKVSSNKVVEGTACAPPGRADAGAFSRRIHHRAGNRRMGGGEWSQHGRPARASHGCGCGPVDWNRRPGFRHRARHRQTAWTIPASATLESAPISATQFSTPATAGRSQQSLQSAANLGGSADFTPHVQSAAAIRSFGNDPGPLPAPAGRARPTS